MYKINNNINIQKIFIRGYHLTKKLNKYQSRHSLVFLRAPKHFNIGKHRVLSFKNQNTFLYNVNLNIPTRILIQYPTQLYNVLLHFHKFHLLHKIVSLKISAKLKITF